MTDATSRTDELLSRARAGDGAAFQELIEPYRSTLLLHCYRMLGSLQDAEDLLQETLLAAWNGLSGFQERASLRTWLYRIATNRGLNALRVVDRRVPRSIPQAERELPQPSRRSTVTWLEPYPDTMLDDLHSTDRGPDGQLDSKETISLAFVTATQILPPRQRAVLILRDVLGFSIRDTAKVMEATESAVTNAHTRARAAVAGAVRADQASDQAERRLADRFAEAFMAGDVDSLVELLTDDATLTMPPLPVEYVGRAAIGNFLQKIAFLDGLRYRLVPTRANGQPAFGMYCYDQHTTLAAHTDSTCSPSTTTASPPSPTSWTPASYAPSVFHEP